MVVIKKKKDSSTGTGPLPGGPHVLINGDGHNGTWDVLKINGPLMNGQPVWAQTCISDKEGHYRPFKSSNGRSTPLEDPYQSDSTPMDPERHLPIRSSRANSVSSGYRISEGSVLYQPLSPVPHATIWSNSLMFNRTPSEIYNDKPVVSAIHVLRLQPDNLHQSTFPDSDSPRPYKSSMRDSRKSSLSSGRIPGGLAYTQINGYISTGAPPEAYQFQKPNTDKPNKVTLMPNGKVLGEPTPPTSHFEFGSSNTTSTDRVIKYRTFLSLAALHISVGLVLFVLGVTRLLLGSIWALGLELVYGIFVAIAGIVGTIGARRRDFCMVTACCVMSSLSCLLCIPPFVSSLLFTIPESSTKLQKLGYEYFSKSESTTHMAVDISVAVICLVELFVAITVSVLGCKIFGKAYKTRSPKIALERLPASDTVYVASNKSC